MNLPPLVPGRLVRRENRFAAAVRVGRSTVRAHVANSGRLGELLVAGAVVYLQAAPPSPARRTTHDLVLVEHGSALVSIDSRAPATIAAEAFAAGALTPLPPAQEVRREVAFGAGRIDLQARISGEEWMVEVKGCTLVREGTAIFPDAPTARGRRHVEELTDHVAAGGRAMVLFVIQRADAGQLRPNRETDPGFAAALQRAGEVGVVLAAHTCRVTTSYLSLDRAVPVRTD